METTERSHTELVGPSDIAARLGVTAQAVAQWKRRGLLPRPVRTISRVPLWEWEDIAEWASRTNHPRRQVG
jgi:predicted DNA-binding transcriptional regulator AlpA